MAEVVRRRYTRGLNEIAHLQSEGKDIDGGKFSILPDLILIDGGKGQLKAAFEVLEELNLDYIPIISLARSMRKYMLIV